MFTEFAYIALAVFLILCADREDYFRYQISFDALLENVALYYLSTGVANFSMSTLITAFIVNSVREKPIFLKSSLLIVRQKVRQSAVYTEL